MPRIDYYLTPISPYVCLAGTRPAEIAARHGCEITYRPLDTTALFARTGGVSLPERHESRKAYRLQELRRQAARAGVALNLRPAFFPANPAPASYAIIAAQAAGGGDLAGLVAGLALATWVEERDIADDTVIRACLEAAGFDPALADRGLLAGAESYGRNLEEAVQNGVFGVPFFVVGDEKFWGQDRLGDLDSYLAGAL